MNWSHFAVYFAVGSGVGLVTVGLRELLAAVLPGDTVVYFSLSVVGAYAIGIILSFVLQRFITFSRRPVHRQYRAFVAFVVVALIGALVTWILAMCFRYIFQFDEIFERYGATAAFALAAVCASAVTYSLNSTLVFRAAGHADA